MRLKTTEGRKIAREWGIREKLITPGRNDHISEFTDQYVDSLQDGHGYVVRSANAGLGCNCRAIYAVCGWCGDVHVWATELVKRGDLGEFSNHCRPEVKENRIQLVDNTEVNAWEQRVLDRLQAQG